MTFKNYLNEAYKPTIAYLRQIYFPVLEEK